MKLVILFPDAEASSNSSLLRKDESDVYYETGSNSGKKIIRNLCFYCL